MKSVSGDLFLLAGVADFVTIGIRIMGMFEKSSWADCPEQSLKVTGEYKYVHGIVFIHSALSIHGLSSLPWTLNSQDALYFYFRELVSATWHFCNSYSDFTRKCCHICRMQDRQCCRGCSKASANSQSILLVVLEHSDCNNRNNSHFHCARIKATLGLHNANMHRPTTVTYSTVTGTITVAAPAVTVSSAT